MTTRSLTSAPLALPTPSPPAAPALPELVAVPALDPVVEAVARALRGARARTGMTEQQVVTMLAEQGFKITPARLRGWERTGVIRVDAAAHLADVYGITVDALAGRGAYRCRHHRPPELFGLPAGP